MFFVYKFKNEEKKKSRIIFWNVSITLFLLSILFVSGETYFRFYVDTTDSFAISKLSKRWMKRYFHENNAKIRDNIPYESKKTPGKRRLTIIGDSFTNGQGIKNINKRFGNILRSKYPKLEIHIFGHSGSNTITEIDHIENLNKINYEFDVVMLAYCLNDVDFYIPESEKIYKRIHAFQNNLTYLAKNSYLINNLSFRYFAYTEPDCKNYTDFVLRGYYGNEWKKQKKSLTELTNLIEKSGGSLFTMTFPFLQQEYKDYRFIDAHRKINTYWESRNIKHIDLLPIYKPYLGEQLIVNKYDAHPNEFAHSLAAETVELFLKGKYKRSTY